MEEITCPNCNVDVDAEELRRNNLICPTCGHDLSEAAEQEDFDLDEDYEWEEEEEEEEEVEEEEEDEEDRW